MSVGGSDRAASPAPPAHPEGVPFGFPEAFGLSFATWFALLPRWLPVMLLLSAPVTAYQHWLTVRPDDAATHSGWEAYRWGVYLLLWLVFGVLTSALMTGAALLRRMGERPTLVTCMRSVLPALPGALLLALLVIVMWSFVALVGLGLRADMRDSEVSPLLFVLTIGVVVGVCGWTLPWGVSLACLIVEGGGAHRALQRSRTLTQGRRLVLLVAWLLMTGMFVATAYIVERSLLAAPDLENTWTEHARAAYEARAVRAIWVQMFVGSLFSSLFFVSVGVCYVGLRRRHEGVAGAEVAEAFR